jgi:hypothetical protein
VILGTLHGADGRVLLPEVMRTTNAFERIRGLLGRAQLPRGSALLIEPCAAVHTIGMRYALDLAFLDKGWRVLKLVERVNPWRLANCRRAHRTLEMPAGAIEQLGLACGMQLTWREQQR